MRQAERRFVGLTALRWLPIGFVAPLLVLLASSRGLSAIDIGTVFTVMGLVTVGTELPTGGLADTLGRRPLLLVSGGLSLLGLLGLAAARNLPTFVAAAALLGLARALDSGPLEAWFVDTAQAAQPGTDTARALSRGGTADGLSLALGAVLGGVLPQLFGGLLVLPFLVAAALTAVGMAAVALLVVPVGPHPDLPGPVRELRRPRRGVADVPRTVREAGRLARRDPALRLLLVVSLGTGFTLGTIELLGPLEAARLSGGDSAGGTAWSLVLGLGFLGAGVGSALALVVRRLAAGSVARAGAVLSVLGAASALLLGAAGSVVVLGAGAVLFYLFNGAGSPLRRSVLHSRVEAAQRTTMLSVGSLALQLGGVLANQVQSRLYASHGALPSFTVAAGVLLALALVQLRLPPVRPPDEDHLTERPADDAAGAAATAGGMPVVLPPR